jgi:D-alanine-D-alanine ligase
MKKVGLICGGFSSEREISLKSSKTILDNISNKYDAKRIIVSSDEWFVEDGDENKIFDLNTMTYDDKKTFDFFIIYLHGDPGENGKIAAFLDIKFAKYINSSPLASSLSFDKWYCNQFLKNFGFEVAKSIYLSKNISVSTEDIVNTLGLPVIVKPTDSGSSFGVSKVDDVVYLDKAIFSAFNEGSSVVIEEFLKGRELTCGVYRLNGEVFTLPIAEIVSHNEFFDYDAKYNGKSDEIIPAKIDDVTSNIISQLTKSIYQRLNLKFIARIDFIFVGDKAYVMEINTTPGFSDASIFPQMVKISGKNLSDFLFELIEYELSYK